MTSKEIQGWLSYWHVAKMVAVDKIQAFDQVYQARKYCSCMRTGLFLDISDLSIWRALCEMRGATRGADNHQMRFGSSPEVSP